MPYRAQRACFGATYVYTILTDIYGVEDEDATTFLPVDQMRFDSSVPLPPQSSSPSSSTGSSGHTNETGAVAETGAEAEVRRPLELGWALGAAVFSALDMKLENRD
jgi:hypothetical protein